MNIDICHIAPTKHILHAGAFSHRHMALAHLCAVGSEYVEAFRTLGREEDNYIYLDNSQFELGYPLPLEMLVKCAEMIHAKCIILPDGEKTGIDEIKALGYDVMYIPAAPDLETDFLDAIHDDRIDYVGLSYSKTSAYLGRPRHSTTSRFDFLGLIGDMLPNKKIHMLGMVTPGEVALMKPYEDAIVSWDSSIAVWAGLNDINVIGMKHKNTSPVDFDSDLPWNVLVNRNIQYLSLLTSI